MFTLNFNIILINSINILLSYYWNGFFNYFLAFVKSTLFPILHPIDPTFIQKTLNYLKTNNLAGFQS